MIILAAASFCCNDIGKITTVSLQRIDCIDVFADKLVYLRIVVAA